MTEAEGKSGDPLCSSPTCLVGSYPQPEMADRPARGFESRWPRLRARELWLVDEQRLEAAQDDATLLAIRDQERRPGTRHRHRR